MPSTNQSGRKSLGSPFSGRLGETIATSDRLVVLTHDTGDPEFKLPAANTDDAFYLLLEAGVDNDIVDVEPLCNGREVNVVLKGTCSPGDNLCLADVATPADKGKVRAIPVGAGTYRPFLKAEAVGVDGQLVQARVFIGLPSVTVGG